jgi:hypothetical protein
MPSTAARRLLGALCAATLLTGCTGGGSGGDGTSDATQELGPLEEYFARVYGWADDDASLEDQNAEYERQQREVERLVADCMREEGFDYVPREHAGVVVGSDGTDLDWGSPEFAEQFGYGISTDPWGWEDRDDTVAPDDPNQEYVDAMSEAERAAYEEALWGPPQEWDEDADPEAYEYDWTRSGCYGAAQHEVWDADADEEFAGLLDEVSRVWEQTAEDPRVRALDAAWSSCMADAGYDEFDGPNEAAPRLHDEWWALQGWDDPSYQALVDGWDWDADPDGPAEPEVDDAAARAFTEREIAVAVADAGCKAEVGYDDGVREVSHEIQQDFVDQHRAELDAWAEAAGRDD